MTYIEFNKAMGSGCRNGYEVLLWIDAYTKGVEYTKRLTERNKLIENKGYSKDEIYETNKQTREVQ